MSRAHIVLTKRQGSTHSVREMKQLRDRYNRSGLLVACAVIAIATASCGGGGGDGFVNPPPASVVVSISPTSGTVNVGGSTSFAVSITGGSPVPTLSTCSSSNSAIATASANGSSCSATGVAPGTATITASASTGQSATAQLTVAALAPALTAFTLTPSTGSVVVGQTLPLTATPTSPVGATVNISYQSGNVAVATVAASGVVTAVAVGSAVITATARGTGANLAPVTIIQTSTVTVIANPCNALLLALPILRTGSIGASSCVLTTDVQRRVDILRVNLTDPTALELRLLPSGFTGYMTALPASDSELVFFTGNPSQEVRRTWHMPAGLTEIRIGAAAAGQTGTYSFSAASVDANVTGCSAVVVSGSLFSTQSLASGDCVYNGRLADEFIVYSARSCVITMTRGATAPVTSPALQVYAGSVLFASDNGGGGINNASVTLASCRSLANDVLTVRATSFGINDFGNYVFTITFGS